MCVCVGRLSLSLSFLQSKVIKDFAFFREIVFPYYGVLIHILVFKMNVRKRKINTSNRICETKRLDKFVS